MFPRLYVILNGAYKNTKSEFYSRDNYGKCKQSSYWNMKQKVHLGGVLGND
jgi:hypothetical protein